MIKNRLISFFLVSTLFANLSCASFAMNDEDKNEKTVSFKRVSNKKSEIEQIVHKIVTNEGQKKGLGKGGIYTNSQKDGELITASEFDKEGNEKSRKQTIRIIEKETVFCSFTSMLVSAVLIGGPIILYNIFKN